MWADRKVNVSSHLVWMFTYEGRRASGVEAIDDGVGVCAPNVGMHHLDVGVLNVARAVSVWITLVLLALCFCSYAVITMLAEPL